MNQKLINPTRLLPISAGFFYFMEYIYLLRDPRWQKKRLLIFDRDEWKCRRCSDKFTNLQVHHLYYNFDLLPWEYPDTALITLCELCHKKAEFVKYVTKQGSAFLRTIGFPSEDIKNIQDLITRKVYDNQDRQSSLRYMEDIKNLLDA